MLPKLIKTKRSTIVWDIYFGSIEQMVCPNTTGGDQQKTGVNQGYYFFSLIPFGDKVLSFLIQKLSLSVCFYHPTWGYGQLW